MTNQKQLLTCREAARRLGVSTPTVREWVKNRGLPAIRLSKRVLYPAVALDQWLAKQTEASAV